EITNEVTPIKVGDTLYLCTAHQRLFALDAASGKEKWHFDPQLITEVGNRGYSSFVSAKHLLTNGHLVIHFGATTVDEFEHTITAQ
ncbi:hypothetical protein ONJ17_25510, partial [Salmonella enterica subsp. enterica serovar Agona]|nr:hypothetical protein [Salmonella enterica subsp. enterica serovar Agona]